MIGVLHFNFNEVTPCPTAMNNERSDAYMIEVILSQQYSPKEVLEMFGDRAGAVVTKELTQIHDVETYEPIDLKTMAYEDRKKA